MHICNMCSLCMCMCTCVATRIHVCNSEPFESRLQIVHPWCIRISVCISLEQGLNTCITKVQLSKSANFTLMPSSDHSNLWICSNFTNCPNNDLSQWRGGSRDPGSHPRSAFALTVSGAFFSLNQLSVCLYPPWHWHFWRAQVWYFVECLSVWVYLTFTLQIRFQCCISGRNTTETWVCVLLGTSYQETHDVCLSHYWWY